MIVAVGWPDEQTTLGLWHEYDDFILRAHSRRTIASRAQFRTSAAPRHGCAQFLRALPVQQPH